DQRQRETAEERAAEMAQIKADKGDNGNQPATSTEPQLQQITLPPAPGEHNGDGTAPHRAEPVVPHIETEAPPPPSSAPATRPREVEPAKKKGKKGTDEPPPNQ
ncbi:MAG TPA: hypothetical protein VE821_13695, partial [Pyrinomonadaceae bacterium]|nr:hypothetical protein [Pyrinomonadaceae bacterium]